MLRLTPQNGLQNTGLLLDGVERHHRCEKELTNNMWVLYGDEANVKEA